MTGRAVVSCDTAYVYIGPTLTTDQRPTSHLGKIRMAIKTLQRFIRIPIHFMFGSFRVGFSGSADRMAYFRLDKSKMVAGCRLGKFCMAIYLCSGSQGPLFVLFYHPCWDFHGLVGEILKRLGENNTRGV